MYAYIAHSIQQTDAHMVNELGDLLQKQGLRPEYWYEHQGQQYSFDMVLGAQLFVGLLTGARHVKTVLQLWEYAKRMGIPALLMAERAVNLPSAIARDPNVLVFRKFAPENPILFVELYFSQHG